VARTISMKRIVVPPRLAFAAALAPASTLASNEVRLDRQVG